MGFVAVSLSVRRPLAQTGEPPPVPNRPPVAELTVTWRFRDFEYSHASTAPPSILNDQFTLILRPCPRGGRDMENC